MKDGGAAGVDLRRFRQPKAIRPKEEGGNDGIAWGRLDVTERHVDCLPLGRR